MINQILNNIKMALGSRILKGSFFKLQHYLLTFLALTSAPWLTRDSTTAR